MKRLLNEVRRARPLLGTFVEIVVPGTSNGRDAAIDSAFAAIEEVQRRMSFHDPASMLSRINRDAAHCAVPVDDWTFEVLGAAAEMHRISGGIFDVTVAPRRSASCSVPGRIAPKGSGSFADVQLLPRRRVRFARSDIQIDLGGIAKGFAVDEAVAALRRAGIGSALVNAGGDLRAFGEMLFPIAVRHPASPAATLTAFTIHDCAIATSAHYFAGCLLAGPTSSPLFHPRRTAEAALPRSVTVRAARAMQADGLTKIVMFMKEEALPVLAHFHADAFFISALGEATCSEGWDATLHFSS